VALLRLALLCGSAQGVTRQSLTEVRRRGILSCVGVSEVYITNDLSGLRLTDVEGAVGLGLNSSDHGDWQRWIVSDAGDGKVYFTSHRQQQRMC